MEIVYTDDEFERLAQHLASRVIEHLQAWSEEEPKPEPEPEDEPEVVPYRADRSEVREFDPAVLPPCRNQWRHMKVAKFLLGRTRPVTAKIIAAKIDATVSDVSSSLQYLANLAPALAEHPRGRSTWWWQATAALRGRGVVAA